MTYAPNLTPRLKSTWRCLGSCLALAFALEPSLSLAQVQVSDPDRAPIAHAKPKPHAAPKKSARKSDPTDNVSDDLNRREAERAQQAVRAFTAGTAATPAVGSVEPAPAQAVTATEPKSPADNLPPTVPAIP